LAQVLSSCTSLRFLRLGFPIVGSMPAPDLIFLLAPLPIEFLSLESPSNYQDDYGDDYALPEDFGFDLIDSLHLLPGLSVIKIRFVWL
jgi:hypothetical protein